jgi:pimeloyl-ACP methyl ester carboxylesterase
LCCVLNVAYAEAGPLDGQPVILLHGWPYDIHTYVEVVPLLATDGYRVIVPYLRWLRARVLFRRTCPNGQPSALAMDIITLMDVLKIGQGDNWRVRLGSADREHSSPALCLNVVRQWCP